MRTPDELVENPECLSVRWQPDKPRVRPLGDSFIEFAAMKHRYVEMRRVQAGNDVARVGHLRIEIAGIREAVDQQSHGFQARPRESKIRWRFRVLFCRMRRAGALLSFEER